MRRTRLYNTKTGKWEYWTVDETALHPWRFLKHEALMAFRRLRDAVRGARRDDPQVLEFDPETLQMRDRRAERRWVRAARRAERLERLHDALISMVEMQKHIK